MIAQIEIWVKEYLHYVADVRGWSVTTIYRDGLVFRRFIGYLAELNMPATTMITADILRGYALSLYAHRKRNGEPLSVNMIRRTLWPLKVFFRHLYRQNLILVNPARDLPLPKKSQRLPRTVFTASQMERILSQPDISTKTGLRDRAILEFFYSTGIRKSELLNLQLQDIDFEREIVHIREGKGMKDRVVPVGSRALYWLACYLKRSRRVLVRRGHENNLVFLSTSGMTISRSWLGLSVARYIRLAEVGKEGNCHSLRHTCATLMIEGGADIRFVQAQLGHSQAETTQLYTRITILALKDMVRKYHPFYFADETQVMLEDTPLGILAMQHLRKYGKVTTAGGRSAHASLFRFLAYCRDKGILSADSFTEKLFTDYEMHISGFNLEGAYHNRLLNAVTNFIAFLNRKGFCCPDFVFGPKAVRRGRKVKNDTPPVVKQKSPRLCRVFSISEDFQNQRRKFTEELRLKNYTARTIRRYEHHLSYFFDFLAAKGITEAQAVTLEHLESYQQYLASYRKKSGETLGYSERYKRAKHVADFFNFLHSANLLLVNHADRMEFPKQPRRLPMNILSADDLTRLFSLADLNPAEILSIPMQKMAWRNRAIMELFLATGMRCAELTKLTFADISRENMTIFIRDGKGNQDRVIPLTQRALYWLAGYTDHNKKYPVKNTVSTTAVFLNDRGRPLNEYNVSDMIDVFFKRAQITIHRANSHLFRHTLATMLLEAGANLRHIQEVLGHKKIGSTEIYTHVSIGKLKEVHTQTHPASLRPTG